MNLKNEFKIKVILLLLTICLGVFLSNAETDQIASAVTAYNKECIAQGLWSGAAVMAGNTEEVYIREAYGWMDKQQTKPMRIDALFDLASITKAVATASALTKCIAADKIVLDQSFTNYLPQYRGTLESSVSVRSLARHISGFDNSKPYNVAGEVVERIMHFSPVRAEGKRYLYSCGNCILLGVIIERVTGKSLADFCADSFWKPMEMHSTFWAPLPQKLVERIVPSGLLHQVSLGTASDESARNARRPIGNAGLFSCVDDLATFAVMILNQGVYKGKRILSEEAVDLLLKKPDERSPCSLIWRMGSEYIPVNMSSAAIGHTGWSGGSLWIDPVNKCYVVVLTNRSGSHAKGKDCRRKLAELILQTGK